VITTKNESNQDRPIELSETSDDRGYHLSRPQPIDQRSALTQGQHPVAMTYPVELFF
jgi:hypothetical protein